MAALTEEQTLIQEQAKSWAAEEAPVAKFREMRDSGNEHGFDKATWAAIGEMGWAGIAIPEAYGGVDLGFGPENLGEASGLSDAARPRESFQPCDDDPRADGSGAAERGADRHVEAALRHGSGEDDGETIGVVGVTLYVGDDALKV